MSRPTLWPGAESRVDTVWHKLQDMLVCSGERVEMSSMTGTNLIGEVHKMRREVPPLCQQEFWLLESREENLVFLVEGTKGKCPDFCSRVIIVG